VRIFGSCAARTWERSDRAQPQHSRQIPSLIVSYKTLSNHIMEQPFLFTCLMIINTARCRWWQDTQPLAPLLHCTYFGCQGVGVWLQPTAARQHTERRAAYLLPRGTADGNAMTMAQISCSRGLTGEEPRAATGFPDLRYRKMSVPGESSPDSHIVSLKLIRITPTERDDSEDLGVVGRTILQRTLRK
jgi:hypothetical protein